MAEKSECSFLTKTGVCVITPGFIELKRSNWRGKIADVLIGTSIGRVLVIYGLFVAAFILGAIQAWTHKSPLPAIMLLMFALVLVRSIIRSLGFSATPEVDREDIIRIDAMPPRKGITRGFFIVHFRDETGKEMKRIIILRGWLEGGTGEYEKALNIFHKEGLIPSASESHT